MNVRRALALAGTSAVALGIAVAVPAQAAGSVISGVAFEDANRNGVLDAGETPLAGHGVELVSSSGALLGARGTDASGRYSFADVPAGSYTVRYDDSTWRTLKADWVPTTTQSIYPRASVTTTGTTTVDFGWRRIVRSSTPVTSFTGSSGVQAYSYNDAVTAEQIAQLFQSGGLVGAEAKATSISLDTGASSFTTTSVLGSPGSYRGYRATVQLSWADWVDNSDRVLFHEAGHAWSMYYAYLVQQDETLAGYLQVRGLTGDSRLDSSHAWSRQEMIAEDYRQLFGTSAAAAVPQENAEIPPAASVPGLRAYLTDAFRGTSSPATSSPSPSPSPSASATPAPSASPTASPSASPTPTAKQRGKK